MLVALERDLGRRERIERKPQRVREIVGRAEGQHGHRFAELDESGQGLRQRPVAAADDDPIGVWPIPAQPGLELLLAVHRYQHVIALGEPLGDQRQGLRRPRRVRD